MTLVYVFGSGECEQLGKYFQICKHSNHYIFEPIFHETTSEKLPLGPIPCLSYLFFLCFRKWYYFLIYGLGLGDDAPSEIKKPRRLQIFELGCSDFAAKSIIKVSCGGMHTVALASNGTLYSWGNNDDGALGRFGQENVPMRVDGALDAPMTDISTGDCHSIAYNINENTVFYWGCYKVSLIKTFGFFLNID